MIQAVDYLNLYLKLQRIILESNITQGLMEKSLPQILAVLSSAGLDYKFISTVLINHEVKLEKAFYADLNSKEVQSILPINLTNLLGNLKQVEKEILWGEPIIFSQIDELVSSEYSKFNQVKSLIVTPLNIERRLVGVLVFATIRSKESIDHQELTFNSIISNLMAQTFRLEDTETKSSFSLSN